jgi:CRP-like cAMP-binding protein
MEPGDMLVKKGDEGRGLYVLETGQVSVMFKEEGEVVTKIGAGDFFGEMALLDEKPRAATVSCDAPGRLLFLSRRDFFKLLRENQKLAAKILFALSHTLSNRLRKTNLSLEDELTEE